MINPSDQFALSVQSISRLKYTARQSPEKGLRQTAQQFEALFLQNMLEAMRDAMPKSDLLHSSQTEMYTGMLDRQWAQSLAERGIGLADMLVTQLDPRIPDANDDVGPSDAGKTIAGIPTVEPHALAPADAVASQTVRTNSVPAAALAETDSLTAREGDTQPLVDLSDNAGPLVSQQIATAAELARRLAALPEHVSAFLDKLAPAAREASRKSGLSERLILAQAALETGWGRHEITGAGNQPSYNAFNIKATGWAGDAVRVNTTEFVDGQARQVQADFRAYDSYQDAFADYVRLLTESPRYQAVVEAPTAESAAYQLQAAGYATDPNYASKLVAVMAQIPASIGGAPNPLFDRSSTGALFGNNAEPEPVAPSDGYINGVRIVQAQVARAYTVEIPLREIF